MLEKIINCIGIVIVFGVMFFLFTLANQADKAQAEETIKAWSQVDKKINTLQKEVLDLKAEAISLGYARYNGTNGSWQWVTNR